MAALSDSLNAAYEVKEGRPWWKSRLIAAVLTLAFAIFTAVALLLVLAGGKMGAVPGGTTVRPGGRVRDSLEHRTPACRPGSRSHSGGPVVSVRTSEESEVEMDDAGQYRCRCLLQFATGKIYQRR